MCILRENNKFITEEPLTKTVNDSLISSNDITPSVPQLHANMSHQASKVNII